VWLNFDETGRGIKSISDDVKLFGVIRQAKGEWDSLLSDIQV
jgi:hypothetical protein